MDFKSLKSSSGSKSLNALTEELNKISNQEGGGKKGDDRFWTPTVDKAGNGYAVLRFLPAPPNEDVPFIRMFDHGFQGPGGWYIENSLTTIGKQDPVSEYNSKLWNSTTDDKSPEREQARKQKRRLHFVSNVYIVQDQANPSNEGKVFLFKYGKKIFDKLKEAMEPQFEDETPMNPFDLWAGANFKLKIRNVEGYRNYDKSEFGKSEPLLQNDSELEKVWNSEHSLKAFLDPSNFKSYEELKAKLVKVLSGETSLKIKKAEEEDVPWSRSEEAPTLKAKSAPSFESAKVGGMTDDDDDESLEFFKSLAG